MAVAMYATLQSNLWPKFHFAIGNTISLLCVAAVIWRVISWQDWATRILNSRVFVFVGILSYSLYVWQQIFLDESGRFWINRFPQNLVLAFLAAAFSYYVVETPFLRLRERLSSRLRARRAAPRLPESDSLVGGHPRPVDQVAS
jgi:peptidoglycan/LPS O-acetylase OafA/YrhL